jgi:hypothetical protein
MSTLKAAFATLSLSLPSPTVDVFLVYEPLAAFGWGPAQSQAPVS